MLRGLSIKTSLEKSLVRCNEWQLCWMLKRSVRHHHSSLQQSRLIISETVWLLAPCMVHMFHFYASPSVVVVLKLTAKECLNGHHGDVWCACHARWSSVVVGSWTSTTESCMTSWSATAASTARRRSVEGIVLLHIWSTANTWLWGQLLRQRLHIRSRLLQLTLMYPLSVTMVSFLLN